MANDLSSASRIADDPRFQVLLVELVERAERKESLDPQQWIDKYPEFAEPLREFFAARSLLRPTASDAPTLAPASSGGSFADCPVRYFGDYELVDEIARGGMGVVYRARQTSLNRVVALKMILSGEFASSADVARFRAEAEAAANLDHPSIVPIYEIGEHQGRHYFSMKFIAGESLAARVKYGAPPATRSALEEIVALVASVARAVHYAHQRGIIHRDLKPANVLIDEEGRAHVTDFGLAKRLASERDLTQSGAILGTPEYMAPEQAIGKPSAITTAADIHGLGAILYALLTHRPPFQGETPLETLMQVVEQAPAPPSSLSRAIDVELQTICLKCLAKDPEQRYRSAGELADDLDRWRRGEPISAAPPSMAKLLYRWFFGNFRAALWILLLGAACGILVSSNAIGMTAKNLTSYSNIYHVYFPEVEPPWLLTLVGSPVGEAVLWLLPLAIVVYLGCGFAIDRLVAPTDVAAALGAGLSVGIVAAAFAFFMGIGWTSLIQNAIWTSETDLEALANTADGRRQLPDQKFIHEAYPRLAERTLPQAQSPGSRLQKKIFADMQARLPIAMWLGFLFAVGLHVAPAALQTTAAYLLRRRGDRWFKAAVHYCELSLPVSLAMFGWGMTAGERPLVAAAILVAPLAIVFAFSRSRRLAHVPRFLVFVALVVVAGWTLWLAWPALFPERDLSLSRGKPSLAVLLLGAIAATLAVIQRWKWRVRLPAYALWFALWAGNWRDISGEADPRLGDLLVMGGCGLLATAISLAAIWHRRIAAGVFAG